MCKLIIMEKAGYSKMDSTKLIIVEDYTDSTIPILIIEFKLINNETRHQQSPAANIPWY